MKARKDAHVANLKIIGASSKNKDIFVLFAALNATGYNEENNGRGMSPVRKRVRRILLRYNWVRKYSQLKRIIKRHHPWYLIKAVLAKPQRCSALDFFIPNLERFSREPLTQKMWDDFKIYQERETKKLLSLFKENTLKLLSFVGASPGKLKSIFLIANPLDAYWRGYSLAIGKTGYVIAGPGAEKNHGELLRHELLHLLAPKLRLPRRIVVGHRLIKIGYGNSGITNREYVVRSFNLLYDSLVLKRNITTAIKRESGDFNNIGEAVNYVRLKIKRGRL